MVWSTRPSPDCTTLGIRVPGCVKNPRIKAHKVNKAGPSQFFRDFFDAILSDDDRQAVGLPATTG